jgi:hypothetical protein
LSALVLGTLVWMLQDYGILNPDNPSLFSWVTLIVIGIIFGIGLSWSLLRARVRWKWIENVVLGENPTNPPALVATS